MTWSLQVSNGDLVLSGAQLGTVSDENKLVQDFRHYLLEHMGSDPLHPWYGSLIDGGVKPNGTTVESVISRTDWAQVVTEIQAEIQRIGSAYQRQQVDRAQRDRNKYSRSTLTLGEVLAAISNIDFRQEADALYVTITLVSGRNQPISTNLVLPPVITH